MFSKSNNCTVSIVNGERIDMMTKKLEFNSRSDTLPTAVSIESLSSSSSISSHCSCGSDENNKKPLHLTATSFANNNNIHADYEILPLIIGEGSFGIVRECIQRNNGEYFAVKSMPKCNIQDSNSFRREIELLQQVDNHKNIISLVEVYEDKDTFHIVTELCQGGELFDQIAQKQKERQITSRTLFSEAHAAGIIHSILDAVAHLHNNNIVHRDLKPENCMLQHKEIKLIDFGFAVTHDSNYDAPMTDVVGTPYYMAPEVLKQKYTKACDIWSVGVMAYILLCGHPPFDGEDDDEVLAKIKRGHYSLDQHIAMSDDAKDFIKCLLRRDPRKRLSAEQALEHPWMIQQ